jgi:predicted nucleic acid-binding protein
VFATVQELVTLHPDAGFAVSRLSMLECLVKPLRDQNTGEIDRYRSFFASAGLQMVEVSSQVIETATLLRVRHGLRTPDAIQAASALSVKVPVTFLTGDKQFTKVPGLNVRLVA